MARNDQARRGPLARKTLRIVGAPRAGEPPFAARASGRFGFQAHTSYIVVQGACDHQLFCDYGQCLTVTGFGRG